MTALTPTTHLPYNRVAATLVLGVLAAACWLAFSPAIAEAVDEYPCGRQVSLAWSSEPVQPCPLTSPTGPNGSIPVYTTPVPNPHGSAPRTPAGWLNGIQGQYFVCEARFTNAAFYHPRGWRNNWWAYTLSDDGHWGWVPEVYFRGGENDEPDAGLRACPPPRPGPPAPPAPPAPAPPAPPASPCEPTPLTTSVRVRARFRNVRRAATVAYGRTLRVRGRVRGRDGSPRAGVSLCVGAQVGANGPVRAIGSVTTDVKGRFRYRIGRGPSRRVWFVHRVGGSAAASRLRVRVRAPMVLRASRRSLRNGQAVVLHGRLRAGRTRGLLVEMQAARGRRWQTFATTRTGRRGRFRYRYRFTRTLGVQNYRLRARISGQPGNPFATGASRAVRVRVVG